MRNERAPRVIVYETPSAFRKTDTKKAKKSKQIVEMLRKERDNRDIGDREYILIDDLIIDALEIIHGDS